MKHYVWSKPDLQWDGFQAVPYWFETEKIWALPLTRNFDDGRTDEATTFGDIISLLRDKQLKPKSFDPGLIGNSFVAADDSLTVAVTGPAFTRDLLRIILQLHSEGIGLFEGIWYYFDDDYCRDDPHKIYFFFVVAKDKIIRERVGFSDYINSGFDPTVFETHDDKHMIWGREASWNEADTHYWYRKFYTETRAGQLMTLRHDNPRLFYYDRTAPDVMAAIGVLQQSLLQIKLVLWILVVIAAINLILHWK